MKSHPTIEGLQINKEGTAVKYLGASIDIRVSKPKARKFLHFYFSLPNHSYQFYLPQLVCEVYHGMAPSKQHQAIHLNGNCNDNTASNLKWGTYSEVRTISCTYTRSNSNIKKADFPKVKKLLKAKKTKTHIAKLFNTSAMSIRRLEIRFNKEAIEKASKAVSKHLVVNQEHKHIEIEDFTKINCYSVYIQKQIEILKEHGFHLQNTLVDA